MFFKMISLSAMTLMFLFVTKMANGAESNDIDLEYLESVREDRGYYDNKLDPSYDYFVLTQNWPQTTCWHVNNIWQDTTKECSSCIMPRSKLRWTLHGLWPSKRGQFGPKQCDKNVRFDPNQLDFRMMQEMELKWPTFNLQISNQKFWSHEYMAHGTCALDHQEINTIPSYFKKGLQLLEQFDVGNILTKENLLPGEYSVEQLYDTILPNLNWVNFQLRCTKNPITQEQYLMEVGICFDKTFQLVHCNYNRNRGNCDPNKQVIFPKSLDYCANEVDSRVQ